MVGIKIDDVHSYNDLGWILTSHSIEAPAPKTTTIQVVGADGVLDYSEFFGEIKFSNRTLNFEFKKVLNNLESVNEWSNFQNQYQGKKAKITLDDDADFYYFGRITLSFTRNKNIFSISMKVDAEPYKMKQLNTIVAITGSGTVTLKNLRKKVVPKIKTTAETKLTFGTTIFNVSSGEYVLPELELSAGENTVKVEGKGTTTFTYREGGL